MRRFFTFSMFPYRKIRIGDRGWQMSQNGLLFYAHSEVDLLLSWLGYRNQDRYSSRRMKGGQAYLNWSVAATHNMERMATSHLWQSESRECCQALTWGLQLSHMPRGRGKPLTLPTSLPTACCPPPRVGRLASSCMTSSGSSVGEPNGLFIPFIHQHESKGRTRLLFIISSLSHSHSW